MEDTYKGQVDNPLTLNRYTYTANNPLRYIDASGNEYTEIGNSLTSSQRRLNVMFDEKTKEAYINLYNTYGPESIPAEHREIVSMMADPSSMIPGAGGVRIVRGVGKAIINGVTKQAASKAVQYTLSNKNKKHVLAHTVEGFSGQLKYLSDEQLIGKLNKDTFFNPKWTEEQVLSAVEQGYNALRQKGLTGAHDYKINGETIRLFIKEDGTLDTAYGMYKFAKEYFGR